MKGGAAGVLAALLIGTSLAPAANAVDADDLVIYGPNIVGAALSVERAYDYFIACDPNPQVNYTVQWLRDGKPVGPSPGYSTALHALTTDDVGSRISVVVSGAQECPPVRVDDPRVIRKEPSRAEGFTGRGAFELEARRSDGVLFSYLGQDASQGWKSVLRIGPGWESFTRIIAPGDITADGLNDILATDLSGALVQYEGYGDGAFTTHYRNVVGSGWNAMDKVVGPGDFDGNGLNDLLASDAKGDLYLYPRVDRSSWSPRVKVGQGWGTMDLIFAPGDFNGDGNVDVMAKDKDGRLFLYGGNGRGGWITPRQVGQGWNALSKIGSVGDFNHDGFSDVHGVNAAGDLLMYYGDGRGGWKGVETVGRGWGGFNGLY
ncbi:FG-GAP repeat domain-containing protein [Paenarthrobacter sp. 2TAF44]|uniref:FG-GAP repeat domain-containing protein n=1 Tax=Paenarthrobacter sp. 2TAF44 TaxID=3233018 RepID=UPI003F97004D